MDSLRQHFLPHSTSASKMQLQQQQDHLVLLHHARKCPHDEGECPVTPHCAETKRLWRHITHCTHKKCPHCYSARKLLTHYRDCKDSKCRICGPVREVVRAKKLEQQQQLQMQLSKTDTYSTSMTTAPSAGRSKTTIDEWVSLRRDHLMTIDGAAGHAGPSPTSESRCARPPIVPVHRRRPSFGSMSSLSHGSSLLSSARSSTRSSVPSSRSGGSRSSGVYCSECIRLGGVRAQRLCSSGIRCRTNLGIAHFCKIDEGSQK